MAINTRTVVDTFTDGFTAETGKVVFELQQDINAADGSILRGNQYGAALGAGGALSQALPVPDGTSAAVTYRARLYIDGQLRRGGQPTEEFSFTLQGGTGTVRLRDLRPAAGAGAIGAPAYVTADSLASALAGYAKSADVSTALAGKGDKTAVDSNTTATQSNATAITAANTAAANRLEASLLTDAYTVPDGMVKPGSTITRNSAGVAVAFPVTWRSGEAGQFSAQAAGQTDANGLILGYTITRVIPGAGAGGANLTRTYTRSGITRDATGAVTNPGSIAVTNA